jgi:perosamine synthetase
VRISPGAAVSRDELMSLLLADGIATRRGVMSIHSEASYGAAGGDLSETEAAGRETLMLPLFPDLTERDQDRVIECIAAAVMAQAA